MFLSTEEKLWKLLDELSTSEGLELYDVENNNGSTLKVFVVKPHPASADKNGVTSEDCTRLCRRLRVFLAAEGTDYGMSEEPGVEVSSPGINRQLRLNRHFESAIGERVKISSATFGESGKKEKQTIVGNLSSFDGNDLVVMVEDRAEEFRCSLKFVENARIDYMF